MTDVWMQYTLPLVQLMGAAMISRRFSWRSHSALIAYLVSESLWYLLPFCGVKASQWSLPVQLAAHTAVLFEVATFARLRVPPEWRGRAVGLALAACAMLAAGGEFTSLQRMYLFRQYYLLALFAALSWVTIERVIHPMIECQRHKIYRIGMTAWSLVFAVSACFIKGGLGYKLLPYTMSTWRAVNTTTYVSLAATVGWMTLRMGGSWTKVPADMVRATWVVARDVRMRVRAAESRGRIAA